MKTVLISGGNKGIGLTITNTLKDKGYTIYCLGRDFKDFTIKQKNVKTIIFDLERVDEISKLVLSLGNIDILINNAGYMYAQNIDQYTIEEQEKIFRVNLEAPIELIKAVLPSMQKQQFGRIVNIASLAGCIGHPDVWYGITKAGLINATISLSHIIKGNGITINAILPGPIATKMVKNFSEERKNFLRKYVNITGQYLPPQSIVECVEWFIDDNHIYLNGNCLEISDGVTWNV